MSEASVAAILAVLDADYPEAAAAVRGRFDGLDAPTKKRKVDDANGSAAAGGAHELGMATKLVQGHFPQPDPYGAANMPIYQTATFKQVSATEFGDYDYTRSGNPTRTAAELALAEAEGCKHAYTFTTGMAALSAVTRLCDSGTEIILSDDSYGGTYRILDKIARRLGIGIKYVALDGDTGPANLEAACTPQTRLVMLESPTNPMHRVCDVRAISAVCKRHGALLEVDNTLMSPLLSSPLKLGADIVVHSATKFCCGHSDTMAGVVCVDDDALAKQIYFVANAEGTALAPFDCWLLLRGLKTMHLRTYKAQDNAVAVARFLQTHAKVTRVLYAGLPDHPGHALHASQSSGAGSVVCFTTGDRALSQRVVSNTRLFNITVSFGSVHSLISCPCDMSHASIPAEVRASREFPEDLVRISVGVEDVGDLIADLNQALAS